MLSSTLGTPTRTGFSYQQRGNVFYYQFWVQYTPLGDASHHQTTAVLYCQPLFNWLCLGSPTLTMDMEAAAAVVWLSYHQHTNRQRQEETQRCLIMPSNREREKEQRVKLDSDASIPLNSQLLISHHQYWITGSSYPVLSQIPYRGKNQQLACIFTNCYEAYLEHFWPLTWWEASPRSSSYVACCFCV